MTLTVGAIWNTLILNSQIRDLWKKAMLSTHRKLFVIHYITGGST